MEKYKNYWQKGKYKCGQCGQVLFESDDKFESGTAWPSFRKAKPKATSTRKDTSYNMTRTEVLCSKCHQHLGHVFNDGKLCGDTHPDAGARFCILSNSLDFDSK